MRRLLPLLLSLVVLAAACSGDDGTASDSSVATSGTAAPTTAVATTASASTAARTTAAATTAAPTTAPPTTAAPTTVARITILVTNDDGIAAPGIDALVGALQQVPGADVVVVAPSENQSGSSDKTTPGGVGSASATTASGYQGTAVAGFPADAVNTALDQLGVVPDVVVSGVNPAQNIGPFVPLSGTIGAARTAARRGIPAIAVSAAPSDTNWAAAAALAVAELQSQRAAGKLGPTANADRTVVSLNAPTCGGGTPTKVVDVPPVAAFPEGLNPLDLPKECATGAPAPADDLAALLAGLAARSIIPADL